MKVYVYNKETLAYIGCREARLDPLETKKAGKEVYAKPINATFTEPPKLEDGKVAIYNVAEDNWGIMNSNIGKYVLNTKNGVIQKLGYHRPINANEVILTEEEFKDIKENPDKYAVKNNELKNISGTQEYQNRINIKKYENLIRAEKEKYDVFLNTPVKFNNALYLPRYIDDYCKLALRTFPLEIWDSTGESSKVMSKDEFDKLRNFLEELVNKAYKEKKDKIKKYKLAIKKLEG